MKKFYYSFGSDEQFPFIGGWVEVEAESRIQADEAFMKEFQCRTPGVLNCACCYTEEEFIKTGFQEHGNMGQFCHKQIQAGRVYPVKEDDVPEFVGQIIDSFEDFLEKKGIEIENPEKAESENPAIIYGTDYGDMSDTLKTLFGEWGIIKKEGSAC